MSPVTRIVTKGTSCSKISSESIEAICNAIPPIPAIETVSCSLDTFEQFKYRTFNYTAIECSSNTDQGQITLDYKEEDDNDSLIFDQVEYNVNDTADVSINDPLPTQDTGKGTPCILVIKVKMMNRNILRHAPTPAPRRSKRTTTQPNWMKSGEFIMAQQSNWLAKAEFLKGLAMSGMFPSAEKDIGRALVKIVTENT
ncbi:unnamed protein product [Mytilus coruscus]|uniref:Uncharacterized protein n=1 Tax=Mytilus coruscus TaxID=42192 RepID=A0A6J8D1L2_MYTCO|nr:unnamed protein product [Mytilus coruscus]